MNMYIRTVIAVVIVFAGLSSSGGGLVVAQAPGDEEAAAPDRLVHDRFVYLRHNEVGGVAKTDTLVLCRPKDDGIESRDVYSRNNLHVGWTPVAVARGKLLALKIDSLISIDLADGTAEQLFPYVTSFERVGDQLFLLRRGGGGGVVEQVDLRRWCRRDLVRLPDMALRPPRLAASPDGRRLAVLAPAADGFAASTVVQVQVINVSRRSIENAGPLLFMMPPLTGGNAFGGPLPPPFWLDDRRVLVVFDRLAEAGPAPGAVVIPAGGAVLRLGAIDVTTGKLADAGALPRFRRGYGEPFFTGRTREGAAKIVIGDLGQYRVDPMTLRLHEDDRVAGEIRWRRGKPPEQLFRGERKLAEQQRFRQVSASPDGHGVVWQTDTGNRAVLNYYSDRQGTVREVARGWFANSWNGNLLSISGNLLWCTSRDLERPAEAKVPEGWSKLDGVAWPVPPAGGGADTRTAAAELFAVATAADRESYKQHEPVELSVTLKNISAMPLEIDRPSIMHQVFDAQMKYARGSAMLDIVAPAVEGAPEKTTIEPGKSVVFRQTLEPYALGKHTVDVRFRDRNGTWRGDVKADELTFTVKRSPDAARLLREKFDRLVAHCRREYDADPSTCDYGRLFDLGSDAVPMLVELLEKTDDAGFRARMGSALVQMADARAMPYFRKVLREQEPGDAATAIESLAVMRRRGLADDAPLELLLETARGHRSPEARRSATRKLAEVRDDRVREAMAKLIGDADGKTAELAARYLAAAEDVDLAEWLELAADKPDEARWLAAQSIVRELERQWSTSRGELPSGTWQQVSADATSLAAYRKVVGSWQKFAAENPRFSEHFFDPDRRRWIGAGTALNPFAEKATMAGAGILERVGKVAGASCRAIPHA